MYKSLNDIMDAYHLHIKKIDRGVPSCSFLKEYKIFPKQAIYAVDHLEQKICYQGGVDKLLGYHPTEFDFQRLGSIIHPDDEKRYLELVNFAYEFAAKNSIKPFELEFSLSYRLRKKDGSYLMVLRNSTVLESDKNGRMIVNFSQLTDISYLSKSNKVEWSMSTDNIDIKAKFNDHMKQKHKGYFSQREYDILLKLRDGMVSKKIAEELHISKHTVDTHRRNMLSKTTCTNTFELLDFAQQNGIL